MMDHESKGEVPQFPNPGQDAMAYDAVAEHNFSIMDRIGDNKIAASIATMVAVGAMGLALARETFARAGSAEAPQAQASSLALKGFKKCKSGKPALQMRLVGSDPLTPNSRDKNLLMSYVPAIDTPIHQELQIKSCKKTKGVTVEVLGRKEDNHKWSKITLKPNRVRKFGYDVTFGSPDPAVNNYDTPNSVGNSAKGMALKAHTRPIKGRSKSVSARVGYLYTAEQMNAALSPTSAAGPTGPTAP